MTSTTVPRVHRFFWAPALALVLDFLLHYFPEENLQPAPETGSFAVVLGVLLVLYLGALAVTFFHHGARSIVNHYIPLVTVFILFLGLWDAATLKFAWLPLPYFPGPDRVLSVFVNDFDMFVSGIYHSLVLLFTGYAVGAVLGLVTGISIGWSRRVSYWVNPVFKFIGPIPATAWIPIAMITFPTSFSAGVFLIALSVWFPVTFMTSSGIAGVKNSYFEVARTLGADNRFLIFRVAVPAAFPLIFIGLFMGLGLSFLTLIAAETLGVKGGLGYLILWAQGWGEYYKVYAVLITIAALFSSLIFVLFKVKDRILIWQKGLIKW
jgi:NitT/TauT family transport system permease protein